MTGGSAHTADDWCEGTPLAFVKRWRRDLYQPRAQALGYGIGRNSSAGGAIYPKHNLTGIERLWQRIDYRSRLQRSNFYNAFNPGLPVPAGQSRPLGRPPWADMGHAFSAL